MTNEERIENMSDSVIARHIEKMLTLTPAEKTSGWQEFEKAVLQVHGNKSLRDIHRALSEKSIHHSQALVAMRNRTEELLSSVARMTFKGKDFNRREFEELYLEFEAVMQKMTNYFAAKADKDPVNDLEGYLKHRGIEDMELIEMLSPMADKMTISDLNYLIDFELKSRKREEDDKDR